jgi:hypothetical protein
MIRDRGDVEESPAGADVPESAASSDQDPDGPRSDADDRARAGTRLGDAAPAEGAASADDTQLAEPVHESSPDRQEAGLTGRGDTDDGAPPPDLPPDEASPEEPGAGVRQ